MKLVIASNNRHKIEEIKDKLKNIELLSLEDLNFFDDIAETGATLKENALQKAVFVYNKFGFDCFSDDTGLEIDALGRKPGVFSARYAGENPKSDKKNVAKVLSELNGQENRKACFKTIIALIFKGNQYFFEGKINGTIAESPLGDNGFGYDSVFIPEGENKTFAMMTLEQKSKISHRAIAIEKLKCFLDDLKI